MREDATECRAEDKASAETEKTTAQNAALDFRDDDEASVAHDAPQRSRRCRHGVGGGEEEGTTWGGRYS